jgi:cellulose synthase/poly-beta-1,6-N-acetylglucosamine synthase-like glycosyltransferase
LNLADVFLFLGFIETVILFLYAIRLYMFIVVSVKARFSSSVVENDSDISSSFVSVLLPIYNEPNVVDRLLKACTSFHSPPYEVIVIDDSDDDLTTRKLEAWRDCSNVKIVHRDSREGWKGGALNEGLCHLDAKSKYIMVFDADFIPPPDILDNFLVKFTDVKIAGVQGYQRHDLNADENWITKGIRVCLSLSNMIELNGRSRLGLFLPLTGSVYMMRTDMSRNLRYEKDITEDWNLSLRVYEKGYKIIYDPTLVSSGECPNTLRRLFRQQARWAEGHTRNFRSHVWKILKCKSLSLREKMDFLFVGFSFLNSVLILTLTFSWLVNVLFPGYFLPPPYAQASIFMLLTTMPAVILASSAALLIEGKKEDIKKIPYVWILNFIATPVIAYAALKGLFTKKGYFHRTYKTGKIFNRKESQRG